MGTFASMRHQGGISSTRDRRRGVGDCCCRRPSLSLFVFFGVWSLLAATGARAESDNGVTFLYPAGGEMFYYLDTVNVTYTSSFPNPYLYTFCSKDNNGVRQVRMQEAAPNDGSTLVSMNFTSNYECWFDLKPDTNGGQGANSQGWTLSSNQRELTTWGLPQADTTSTVTASPLATNDVATSRADTPVDGENKGLSAGAKAGIGISVTMVVLGIAGFFGSVWYRRRKQQQRVQQQIINLANAGHFEKRPSSYGGGSYYFSVMPDRWDDDQPLTGGAGPCGGDSSSGGGGGAGAGGGGGGGGNFRYPSSPPHSPPGYVEDEHMLGAQQLPGFYGKDDARSDHSTSLYGPATPDMPPVRPASPVLGAVELPSRDGHFGYGYEQELPDTQAGSHPRQYMPSGREAQEQKFLLQDMLPVKLQRPRPRDRDGDAGPAG